MTQPLLPLPPLEPWTQQLAGILPLSALIEFIDVAAKLHSTELDTAVCLWNWPITPSGARLMLANEDLEHACCLDRTQHSATLHCFDGRHGDWYPSSTPTTTRMCCQTSPVHKMIPCRTLGPFEPPARKQKLEIVQLVPSSNSPLGKAGLRNYARRAFKRYNLVSVTGWSLWTAAVVISVLSRLYLALPYLILMPLTGLTVRNIHGAQPRQLLDNRLSQHRRLVVAADSLNGSRWMGFLGSNFTINSLLNKPLYQRGAAAERFQRPLRAFLMLLILGQWTLAIGACAQQGWDALFIAVWIGLCAVATSYGYPTQSAVRAWLRRECGLAVTRVVAEFSSRRALLSALVYLNPDSRERRTAWIDPILKPCEDRQAWEKALLDCILYGEADEKARNQYWWRFIEEGLQVGREIEQALISTNREASS